MLTLAQLNSPPPEALKSQVLQMVVDYLSDISHVGRVQPAHLYPAGCTRPTKPRQIKK
jgi:hypothetical protein